MKNRQRAISLIESRRKNDPALDVFLNNGFHRLTSVEFDKYITFVDNYEDGVITDSLNIPFHKDPPLAKGEPLKLGGRMRVIDLNDPTVQTGDRYESTRLEAISVIKYSDDEGFNYQLNLWLDKQEATSDNFETIEEVIAKVQDVMSKRELSPSIIASMGLELG